MNIAAENIVSRTSDRVFVVEVEPRQPQASDAEPAHIGSEQDSEG